MKKVIFLDDERNIEDVTWIRYPTHIQVEVVRTFQQFKKCVDALNTLENVMFSFDHDIQDFETVNGFEVERTGMDCVKYLIECMMIRECLKVSDLDVIVHSQNPIGKENIEGYVRSYRKFVSVT